VQVDEREFGDMSKAVEDWKLELVRDPSCDGVPGIRLPHLVVSSSELGDPDGEMLPGAACGPRYPLLIHADDKVWRSS